MYILVNHAIQNPVEFWGLAKGNLVGLPGGGVKRVLNVFPNQNMDACICIWEAESITILETYLRSKLGTSSRETYFEINEANAVGLN